MSHARSAAWFCLALGLNACALLSKGEVPSRRYFSPDLAVGAPTASATPSNLELRLGRVTAGACLSERVMFRESTHEVGFYDDRIWTEKPEAYLRRELTRVLFEQKGLRRVVRGAAPTLEVELISFEEVKGPRHLGRVEIAFSLSDERLVSLQQTLSVERPVAPSSHDAEASAVAQAIGEALRDAIDEISARVATELSNAAPVVSRRQVAAEP